jgi:hypothetical protein
MEFIGIHPDRVKKLMVSTNVLGKKLNDKLKLGDYAFFGPSVKFTWLCLKT